MAIGKFSIRIYVFSRFQVPFIPKSPDSVYNFFSRQYFKNKVCNIRPTAINIYKVKIYI